MHKPAKHSKNFIQILNNVVPRDLYTWCVYLSRIFYKPDSSQDAFSIIIKISILQNQLPLSDCEAKTRNWVGGSILQACSVWTNFSKLRAQSRDKTRLGFSPRLRNLRQETQEYEQFSTKTTSIFLETAFSYTHGHINTIPQ